MGATHVTVTIRNPADPERQWTGRFLVDTGAFDSLVPRRHLEEIGLEPLARETYVLADGSPIDVDTTVGRIEFMGKIVGGTLVFGDGDAEPQLGVTALESGGFEVDPRSQQLKKLPAVLLKALRRSLTAHGRPARMSDYESPADPGVRPVRVGGGRPGGGSDGRSRSAGV